MKVLVACESSGTVRDAFLRRGHDAISCDLLPTESPGPHCQGDVTPLLRERWGLVLAFPPCTDLASSGARWFPQKRADGRQQASIDFFLQFTRLDCPWAIENPVGIMSTVYRKPDQIIQPYHYGDSARKTTCLWLNDLPPLQPTHVVDPGPIHVTKSGRRLPAWYNLPPSPDRARIRSRTFPGIAAAMADAWG